MKGKHPKVWWKEAKRISGMSSLTVDLLCKIKINYLEGFPSVKIAAIAIKKAFLEQLEEYKLPSPLCPVQLENYPEVLDVSERRIFKLLSNLNPGKAAGPDGITKWLLKEYADSFAFFIKIIINALFKQQCLPDILKCVDVTPLPKKYPVENLKKDLRPISLTPLDN